MIFIVLAIQAVLCCYINNPTVISKPPRRILIPMTHLWDVSQLAQLQRTGTVCALVSALTFTHQHSALNPYHSSLALVRSVARSIARTRVTRAARDLCATAFTYQLKKRDVERRAQWRPVDGAACIDAAAHRVCVQVVSRNYTTQLRDRRQRGQHRHARTRCGCDIAQLPSACGGNDMRRRRRRRSVRAPIPLFIWSECLRRHIPIDIPP